MLRPFPTNSSHDAGNSAHGPPCTSCRKRSVECDRVRPTCGECLRNGTSCRFTVTNTALSEKMRDPLHLREMETRLKKIEAQLRAHSAGGGSSSSNGRTAMQEKTVKVSKAPTEPVSKFSLGPGGLCIETNITEAHHFVKLLFNTIDVDKIKQRAHAMFDIAMPVPKNAEAMPELAARLMPQLLSMDDRIEEAWLDMVITSRHHRCLIVYQMVGRERVSWPTSYLRQLAAENRIEELLLAMSMRAYIYQHENELHQNSEFPFRMPKGYDYVQCAKVLLEECYSVSSRITIRALLHLFFFYIHHRPEESFLYSDLAIRMAQDLNLHKKGQGRDEDDRRLWWAVYWCHLVTVVRYDRPFMMMDEDIHVDFPCKLPEEDVDVGYCINYCITSIKLVRIHRTIAQSLRKQWEIGPFLHHIRRIEEELDAWQADLPAHARVDINRQEQDNLCVELGMMLNAQFQGVKIQMYQCFLENTQHLSLVAIQSCNKALDSITDMLIRHGSTMRICGWIRILPTLHQSVAVVAASAQSNESLEQLKLLQSILISHSFSFLKEIRAIVDLIDKTVNEVKVKSLEASASPASSGIRNDTMFIAMEQAPEGPSSRLGSRVDMRTMNRLPRDDPYLTRVAMTSAVPLPASIKEVLLLPVHEVTDLAVLAQGSSGNGINASIRNTGSSSSSSSSSSRAGEISLLSDTSGSRASFGLESDNTRGAQWSMIHKKHAMMDQQWTDSTLPSRRITAIPREEWVSSSSANTDMVGWTTAAEPARVNSMIASDWMADIPNKNNVLVQSTSDPYTQFWPNMTAVVDSSNALGVERSTGVNPGNQHSVTGTADNYLLNQILQQQHHHHHTPQWDIHEEALLQKWSTPARTLPSTKPSQQDYMQQWPLTTADSTTTSSLRLNMGGAQQDTLEQLITVKSSKQPDNRVQHKAFPLHDGIRQAVNNASVWHPMTSSEGSARVLPSSMSQASQQMLPSTTTNWSATESGINGAATAHPIAQQQLLQQHPSSGVLLPLQPVFDFVEWLVPHPAQPQQNNNSSSTYQQNMYSQQFPFNPPAP